MPPSRKKVRVAHDEGEAKAKRIVDLQAKLAEATTTVHDGM